jgi:predicted RNase H-like HicB family nuclease
MKKRFSASLTREGPWVVAQCLEIDLASQGESAKEALANLKEALALYFEDPQATVRPEVRVVEVDVSAA